MRACVSLLFAASLAACDERSYGPPTNAAPAAANLAPPPAPAPTAIFAESFAGASAAGNAIQAQHGWTLDGDCQSLRFAPIAACGEGGCVRIEGTADAGCRLSTTVRLPQVPAGERLVLVLRQQYRFAAGSSGTLRVSAAGEFGPVQLTRRFSLGTGAEGAWRSYLADLSDLTDGDYEIGLTLNASFASFSWSIDDLVLQREPR